MPLSWKPYRPDSANPWTRAKAAHLYRRAGFGGTLGEIDRATADGPGAAIDRLLAGARESDAQAELSAALAHPDALPPGANQERLSAWWLARLLATSHPLRERMTLFWHNHFATSFAKVKDARLMLGQYRLLHEFALGDFAELARRMTTDPAMMLWLDTAGSKKQKPNENYARELMELFTLGVGNYTEADVREAARAFTGYELKAGKAEFKSKAHDKAPKTVLGVTKAFGADDIVALCLSQPACPLFLARKLYREFVSETTVPADDELAPLAEAIRESKFDAAKAVEFVLRSETFFAPAAYRQKLKSPVEYALAVVRPLGGKPPALPLARSLESLGQVLFAPPSVKGWPGGAGWLNSATLLARHNLALALVGGEDRAFRDKASPLPLVEGLGGREALDRYLAVWLDGVPTAANRERLETLASERADRETQARALAHLVLTLPEFQLN